MEFVKFLLKFRRMTSDIDSLHMTSARQRDLLEVKDRQSVETDERERRNSFLLHNSQQQLKAEKDEVFNKDSFVLILASHTY